MFTHGCERARTELGGVISGADGANGPGVSASRATSGAATATCVCGSGATTAARRKFSATPARASSAAKERRYGDRGVIAFSDLLSASLGVLGYTKSQAGQSGFGITPAVDYFIDPNFFVGVSSFIRYSNTTTTQGVKSSTWSGGASLNLGRNVPLSALFSVRPKLALGYWHASTSVDAVFLQDGAFYGPSQYDENVVVLDLYVPVLLHPAPHVFIGFGPDAYFDPVHSTTSGASTTEHLRYFVGASSLVGGWL